jgi:hypothetical protein
MALYTVVSLSEDGVRRSTTLEAESKDAAKSAVEKMNLAIADQEQSKAYTVSEVTKD